MKSEYDRLKEQKHSIIAKQTASIQVFCAASCDKYVSLTFERPTPGPQGRLRMNVECPECRALLLLVTFPHTGLFQIECATESDD